MAYVINKFNGEQLIVLEDGTIDTSTSVGLVGRNYVGYGETQNENFIYLLENFANRTPPARPLVGQMWFNSTNNVAYVYNGSDWGPIGAAVLGELPPTDPTAGALWLRTTDNTLHVWIGSEWRFIGPEAVPGFGSTRAKATTLTDQEGAVRPVIIIETNNVPIAVCTSEAFEVDTNSAVFGITRNLIAGINLSTIAKINGSVTGNAGSADRLSSPRLINGVSFDGQQNITIKSSTTNKLLKGTYIAGNDFDGSTATTWSVDATSANVIGKVVARNSEGGFSAGTIAATFVGNLTGNVVSNTGTSRFNIIEANTFVGATLTGNANSASQLATARRINGVLFNGTADVTVPAASNTLTGNVLSTSVTQSNLESVGTLSSLNISGPINFVNGLQIASNSAGVSTIVDNVLQFIVRGNSNTSLTLVNGETNLSAGGNSISTGALLPGVGTNVDFGNPELKFNTVYATYFKGVDVEVSSITSANPSSNITANGNLIVTGNLTVQGNVTAVNSTELTIEDKLVTLASGAATAADANGAGIFINGAGASLMYSSTGNKWVLNKVLDTGSNDIITTGLFRGTATSAQYADLAENYVADAVYEPGTVLEIGGEYEVTLAQMNTNKVAGIVSTNPAYLMNSQCVGNNIVAVALQGRVPCKVTGTIKKGDMLVSAGNGFATSTNQPQFGTIVGKSLENFDGIDGIIEVLVGRN